MNEFASKVERDLKLFSQRISLIVRLIGLATISAPVAILLHELGHYSVAIAAGLTPQLHATYITLDSASEISLLDSRFVLTILGGVAISNLLLIMAIFAVKKRKQGHSILYFIAGHYPLCAYCYFLILIFYATSTAIGYPIPPFEHNTDEFKLSLIISQVAIGEQNNNIIVACLAFFIATPLILFHILQSLVDRQMTREEGDIMLKCLITGAILGSWIWIYFFKF